MLQFIRSSLAQIPFRPFDQSAPDSLHGAPGSPFTRNSVCRLVYFRIAATAELRHWQKQKKASSSPPLLLFEIYGDAERDASTRGIENEAAAAAFIDKQIAIP